MYDCVYEYRYACICMHAYVCMHTCNTYDCIRYACLSVGLRSCMYLRVYISLLVCLYVCTCMLASMCICLYVRIYVYVYMYVCCTLFVLFVCLMLVINGLYKSALSKNPLEAFQNIVDYVCKSQTTF